MARYAATDSDWTHIRRDCTWKENKLYFRERLIGQVVPDGKYPRMWRVKRPDGSLSDMVNLTRAKDAAVNQAVRLAKA